jgi:FkbM family methyltransferase
MDPQERWYQESLPLRDQIIVDVGANVGRLSAFFYHAGQGTNRVVSVEPLAENIAEIAARIAAADAEDRWTIEACAASAQVGELVLKVGSSEDTPWNSVVVSDPELFPAPGRVRVACKPLSLLAAEATLIKLDIEGHEYEVLDEALAKLPGVSAWALELHMRPDRPLSATTQAFLQKGYRLLGAGRRRDDPSGAWMSVELPKAMEWDAVPVAQRRPDGSVFKMLHVLALR